MNCEGVSVFEGQSKRVRTRSFHPPIYGKWLCARRAVGRFGLVWLFQRPDAP